MNVVVEIVRQSCSSIFFIGILKRFFSLFRILIVGMFARLMVKDTNSNLIVLRVTANSWHFSGISFFRVLG